MAAKPETWRLRAWRKRVATLRKWQRRRASIFAFLKTHSVPETASHFDLSRQRIYQLIRKRKKNPQYGDKHYSAPPYVEPPSREEVKRSRELAEHERLVTLGVAEHEIRWLKYVRWLRRRRKTNSRQISNEK